MFRVIKIFQDGLQEKKKVHIGLLRTILTILSTFERDNDNKLINLLFVFPSGGIFIGPVFSLQ